MEKYKNLYKNRTPNLPAGRQNVQESRRKQRAEQHLKARNISPMCSHQDSVEQAENGNKSGDTERLVEYEAQKENVNNDHFSNIKPNGKDPNILRKQYEYLKRFTEWKQNKKLRQEISMKAKTKKPFIPVGSASYTASFVPKDHKNFTAPSGLKHPPICKKDTTTVKSRRSIYKINSPPKKAKLLETERRKLPFVVVDKAALLSSSRTKLARDKKQRQTTLKNTVIKNSAPSNLVSAFHPVVSTVSKNMKSSGVIDKVLLKATKTVETQQTQIKRPLTRSRPMVKRIMPEPAPASTGAIKKARSTQIKRDMDKPKATLKSARLGMNMKSKPINVTAKNNVKSSTALKSLILETDFNETPIDFNCTNRYVNIITSTQVKKPIVKESDDANFEPPAPHKEIANNCEKFKFIRYSVVDESLSDQEQQQEDGVTKDVLDNQISDEKQIINEPKSFKTPKKSEDHTLTNYVSPFVTLSRGKVSRKQEDNTRNSIYLQLEDEQILGKTTLEANFTEASKADVAVRRTLESVRYFRHQLQDEIDRLHHLCDIWEDYKQTNLEKLQEINGDDMINVTIGQTKLLTSKKFMQFRELIDRCEARAIGRDKVQDDGSENTKLINDTDLEGFWSMLKLQVENVDKRFDNLNRWKVNDWKDPDAMALAENKSKPKIKKRQQDKFPRSKPSSLITMIRKMQAEARKNKAKQGEAKDNEADIILTTPMSKIRRSGICRDLTPSQLSGNNTPNRIPAIVKDRKSFSQAATVLFLSSSKKRYSQCPGKASPDCVISPSIIQFNRNLESFESLLSKRKSDILIKSNLNGTPPSKSKIVADSILHTPQAGRKSILKTPGTTKNKLRNVIFDEKLRVKTFNFLMNENNENEQPNGERTINDRHENDLEKSPKKEGYERTYSLRTRNVHLRPSEEIIIPK